MIRKILMGLAAVVGFTTAATAATPVGVWDGFNSMTSGDYTWTKSAGTTVEEGVVTIGSDGGLTIANPTGLGDKAVTFIADIEGFDPDGAQMTIFDIGIGANRVNISSRPSDNNVFQLWNADNGYGNVGTLSTGKVRIITTYSGGSGTTTYVVGGNTADSGKLKSSGSAIDSLGIGCYKGTERVAEGMKVYRLAMFNSKLSEAEAKAYQFPSEIREFYATLNGDVDGWSDLDDKWNPSKPAEGFAATDTLIVTNAANDHLNMDQDVTARKLKFVSSPGVDELELTKNDDWTLEIGTYDFSEAESKMTVKYEMTASVVAGKDTVLDWANDPSLTIAEGNKLTVNAEENGCSLTASKVSNAGTLHFEGGTAASPIALTGNANFGVITLAENTYVKHDDKAGNRKYQVTGSGASSFYEVTRNNGGSAGMADGSTFENLILVSGATGDATTWLERATLTNVGLDAKGAFKINGFTPTIRSLTGSGTVGKNGTAALTIACTEAANYAGASDLAFTIAEGTALQTLSGAYTGALTVEEDGQVKLTGAANPSSISGLGSVTIASGTGVATNTSNLANFTGTITVDASVTTLNLGTSRPTCDFVFSGATEVVYTENVSDDGVVQQLNVTSGDEPTYKVMGVDGTEKVITEGKYTPTVTGKAAWYAWEFSGNLDSVGQNTEAMGKDHGPFYTDDNAAVYAYSQTWKNLTWPDEFTTAIACTLPTNANVCLVGWGQKSGGFALTAGDVSKNEVKLVYWPSDTQYTVLTTMTVPNASTCEHLYLVTKTANSIKVYLDGALNAEYKGALTLGLGIQVGTVFQGVGKTGLIRLDEVYSGTNDCKAVVNSLRIYKTVLGPNAMAQLVNEFPYVSPNGTFTRALTGAENQWVADGAWTKKGVTEPYAKPDAESTVDLSAAAEATITLNLDEPTDYEALNLTGDGAITIAAPAANENKISSSGLVKISSDATIEYSAMSLAGTTIEIAADKTLTVDCSMIDLSQYYASTTIPLTGLVTGDGEIAFEVPEAITGRSAEAVFNESNNTWELKIEVISAPFIYDGGEWTWSGEAVTTETVSNNTDVAVLVRSGTLEWPMDRASFEVQGGTLKAATAPAVPCTVEVTQKAGTFDLNGIAPASEANNFTVTMAGGKLTNSSETMGIVKSLTITAESTVDTSVGAIAIQSQKGGWAATTLDIGENTLIKEGTNRLEFVATTVSGTGAISLYGGTIWTQESSNFGEALIRLRDTCAFEVRKGVTATVKNFDGNGEGAKIIVHGTISDFTLTDTATIEGEGTFGTITLDGDLYIGEKRGLSIEGGYAVHAQLTLAEMAAAEPITLFTTTSEEITVWLTDYNGRDLKEGTDYTIEGGVVTPKAIPFIYNDGWTWNKDSVTPEFVASVPDAAIVVEGGTCEWNIDRDITVNGGTLKATGTKKANAAITVGENGTFDVNGVNNTEWNIALGGGKLVNDGTTIGETKKQMSGLTLTADSYIGGAGDFGLISNSYNPNTLDLGGYELTKVSTNTFYLCNTTVTNGSIVVTKGGGIKVLGDGQTTKTTRFVDASISFGSNTTFAVAGGAALEISAIDAWDGAVIENSGTISAFELKGRATLTGESTWNAITLADNATAIVGEKRGFTFGGEGHVWVDLTDKEYDAGEVEVFTAVGEDVSIGKVYYNGVDITQDCTISGGKITAISKGIWTVGKKSFPTLKAAYDSLDEEEGGTIKLTASTSIEEETMFEIRKDYVTIDLGGNELTMAKGFDIYNGYFALTNGTLEATNGVAIAFVPTSDVELVVSGGVTVTSSNDVLVVTNGTVTINGGTFTAGTDGYAVKASGGEVAITGGTFNGAVTNLESSTALTGNISGGQFSVKPDDELVAYGYKLVQEGNYWKVVECIAVESVTLNHEKATLTKGGEPLQLLITAITPANADTNKVEWSSDTACATVSETGLVTPLTKGTATITCTVSDKTGSSASATCAITVHEGRLYYEPVIDSVTDEVTGYVAMSNLANEVNVQQEYGDYALSDENNDGWYYFLGTEQYLLNGSFTVSGNVKLILRQGLALTAKSIEVPSGSSLTIYSQTTNDSNLAVVTLTGAVDQHAGIGASGEDKSSGAITINGGKIIAKGGAYAAGIGGAQGGNGSNITINGGIVTASSAYYGAGIGGGYGASGSNIKIRGGTVTAKGGPAYDTWGEGAGIGGGGGLVGATPAVSAGTGTNIRIIGGIVEATAGGTRAVGIGSGYSDNAPASSDIYAKDSVVIVAGADYESSAVVEHQSTTDLAGLDAFKKPYVGAGKIPMVDPTQGGVIECDDEETATALAKAITDNPSAYVKAPEGLDATAAAIYKGMFCATASGTTVTLKLTEAGESFLQGIVDAATDDPDIAAALCDPTATSITYADGTYLLGFYYWVAGGTDVTALTTNGAAVQPTAYGDMTLDKPALGTTTQGFYVIKADFKAPQPAADKDKDQTLAPIWIVK